MYQEVKVHVPKEFHEKIKSLLAKDQSKKGIPIKLNIEKGDELLLLTRGQIIRMQKARSQGKKTITLRFSRKQVQANVQHEGGFLSAIMSVASKVLPTLLTGLASGLISGLAEKAITKSGSGLYLGKRGRGVSKIHLVEGGGLYLSPLFHPEEEDYDGLWMKDGNHTYGAGLILGKDSPFRNVPLLAWLL